jgi:catechol 2,3-dioxygenase-like lactoylglutathione lyase family enzyme
MRGDVVDRIYGVHEGRETDTFFGAFRTVAEAEAEIAELRAREMNGRNWMEQYHNRGFVIREAVVQTDFEIPPRPKSRDRYFVRDTRKDHQPGPIASTIVEIFRRGRGKAAGGDRRFGTVGLHRLIGLTGVRVAAKGLCARLHAWRVTIKRMDNVLIVVDDMEAAKAFFAALGMTLVGETTVEGEWADRVVGLKNVRADIAMMRTPDGHGQVELSKFHAPAAVRFGPENVPSNTLGMRRIMFLVDDLDATLAQLRPAGASLVDEVAQYEDKYRLCFVRGPEGIVVGLAEELNGPSPNPGQKSGGGRGNKPPSK